MHIILTCAGQHFYFLVSKLLKFTELNEQPHNRQGSSGHVHLAKLLQQRDELLLVDDAAVGALALEGNHSRHRPLGGRRQPWTHGSTHVGQTLLDSRNAPRHGHLKSAALLL